MNKKTFILVLPLLISITPETALSASTQIEALLTLRPMAQQDIIYKNNCYRYADEIGCHDNENLDIFIATDERATPPQSIVDLESISITQYIYQ